MSRSEENDLSEAAKALGIGAVLPSAYEDLLSPAAKELGQGLATLAKAVRVSLAPVDGVVWGFDRIKDWLSIKVTAILAERGVQEVRAAPTSIAGPLIMNMVFASEEPDLREMYARLLASSMDPNREKRAHPSFVSVIQQLSTSEARILQHVSSLDYENTIWEGKLETLDLSDALRNVCINAGVVDEDLADIGIENLIRLRIFQHSTAFDVNNIPAGGDRGTVWEAMAVAEGEEWVMVSAYGAAFIRSSVAI